MWPKHPAPAPNPLCLPLFHAHLMAGESHQLLKLLQTELGVEALCELLGTNPLWRRATFPSLNRFLPAFELLT